MTDKIMWEKDLAGAERDVIGTEKLVLMFFHHPECGGCAKTMSITFMDTEVADFVNGNFSPVSLLVTEAQDLTARYGIEWTPTFVLANGYGSELERWVGYLPPEDFITQLHLSLGLAEFHRQRFGNAEDAFEWIIDNRPRSEFAPQARYYMGVALYKESGDPVHLTRTWDAMSKRYPGNYWTKKASAWS